MKRRAALLLAVTAACGASTVTVDAGGPTSHRPYRDLPDVPERAALVELPSQYEIPARLTRPVLQRDRVRASRSAASAGRELRARTPAGAAPLACIRAHESDTSGGYRAVSANGLWFGAYQFDLITWRGAVTRAGFPEYADTRPDQAPAHVQDAAARQLYSERGLQPWPPARRCA